MIHIDDTQMIYSGIGGDRWMRLGVSVWGPMLTAQRLETCVLGNRQILQNDLSADDVNVETRLAAFRGWQQLLKLQQIAHV